MSRTTSWGSTVPKMSNRSLLFATRKRVSLIFLKLTTKKKFKFKREKKSQIRIRFAQKKVAQICDTFIATTRLGKTSYTKKKRDMLFKNGLHPVIFATLIRKVRAERFSTYTPCTFSQSNAGSARGKKMLAYIKPTWLMVVDPVCVAELVTLAAALIVALSARSPCLEPLARPLSRVLQCNAGAMPWRSTSSRLRSPPSSDATGAPCNALTN